MNTSIPASLVLREALLAFASAAIDPEIEEKSVSFLCSKAELMLPLEEFRWRYIGPITEALLKRIPAGAMFVPQDDTTGGSFESGSFRNICMSINQVDPQDKLGPIEFVLRVRYRKRLSPAAEA